MKPSFPELVEINELQSLCEIFSKLTGFVTAILDMEGNVLVATGWQEICTEFHRKNPETAEACRKSDTVLGELLFPGAKYRVYRCKNGLVDVSVPIMVENLQIGRLYTGQFLLAPPDVEFFRCQAAQYGFDETSYLEAVQKVQIVTEEQVAQVMEFLCRLAEMIGRMGLANQRLREVNEELCENRQELERRVDERTTELSAKNEQLRMEIAERKHAEEALRKSEEKYRAVADFTYDCETWLGPDGRLIYVSPSCERISGCAAEEFINDPALITKIVHPDDREAVGKHLEKVLAGNIPFHQMDYRIITRDGGEYWIEHCCQSVYGKDGKWLGQRASNRDITERKLAQEAQLRLNRELMAISRCHEVLIRATDEETLLRDICRIICDEAGYRMAWVGYAEHDEVKSVRPVAWAGVEDGYLIDAHITWADTECGRGPTGKAIRSGECVCIQDFTADPQAAPWRERALLRGYHSSIALPLKDETSSTFGVINIYSTEPDTFTPDEMRLLGKLADDLAFGISTLRTRAQGNQSSRDLQKSNELLRAIIDAAPTAIIGLDLDGRVQTVWNPAAERMLGWSAREAMGNFLPSVPLDKEEEFRRFRESIRSGKILNGIEVRRQRRDGTPIDYSIYASPLHDLDGRIIGNIAVLVDITERKQVDELLQENLIRLQTMVRNAPIILYGVDRKGVFTLSEGKGLAGMGLNPGEIVGLSAFDVYRDYPDCLENFRRALAGEAFKAPVHFGDLVYDAYHEPVFGDDGVYDGTFGVVVDVTERTHAEEALRQASLVVENSPAVLFRWRAAPGWPVELVSANVTQFGYTPEEFLSGALPFASIIHPQDLERVASEVSAYSERGDDQFQQEYRIVSRDGSVRWLDDRTVIERNGEGTITHYQGILMDITERKLAEEHVRSSLAEKEILLKEVHHRVKNNLQIISTLLDLQFEKIKDEHSLTALQESQDRIKAMALIHERLYQSSDLASIDFAEYIEKLAYFLFNSYMADQEQITLTVDVGHLPLDIDMAIPCGLIVNELVSNALKHAFPDGRKGEISIRLRSGDDGMIRLTVADNGTGLPPELDFRNTETLGLQLVNMLTRQLRGEIEMSGDHGTLWEISFRTMDNAKSGSA
jgi:PAS domain S-box-containing protein